MPGMPGKTGQGVLEVPKTRAIGKHNVDNRLSVTELRREIHDSKVCYLAIEMARTGRRPVYDAKKKKMVLENLSEAAHIDVIKFLANKVLANAKEAPTADEKAAHDKWAAIATKVEVV